MDIKEIRIGKELADVSHSMKHCLNNRVMEQYPDLNGFQMRIMGFIAVKECSGDVVCQKDIETEFKIKGSSVTSVLNNMEKNGYIERREVATDKRRKSIVLTEKARVVGQANMHIIDDFESLIKKNMSDDEISTLYTLLCKVSKNIDDMRGSNK